MRFIQCTKCRMLLVLFCLSCLGVASANAQPGQYIFTKIPAPVAGAFGTNARGINDSGEIAGGYFTEGSTLPCDAGVTGLGFLLSDGQFSSFDLPPTCITQFHGINNVGQVVAEKQGPGQGRYLYSGGQFSMIDAPCVVDGINDVGHMVGSWFASGSVAGCLLAEGSVSYISVPGAVSTGAGGINNAGQIVGGFSTCDAPPPHTCGAPPFFFRGHGFLLTEGTFSTIEFPGFSNTGATGISNSGAIIGAYTDDSGFPIPLPIHGFILDQQVYSTVDFPGSFSTFPSGINAAGEIVGFFQASPPGGAGESGAFLARPAAVVNDLVDLNSVETSFDPTPVPGGSAGTFTIQAGFTNISSTPIDTPQFVVTKLVRQGHPHEGGGLLLNADLPPGSVGARLTADAGSDGILSPGESLTATFVIGLPERQTFTFMVDLLGSNAP